MEILNSVISLQPGMYILRHPKGGLAPLSIGIAPTNGIAGRLERLATPGTQGGVLRDGADCIVVHVIDAPVDIVVTAFLAAAGDPVPQLRLDRIGLDAPRAAAVANEVANAAAKPVAEAATQAATQAPTPAAPQTPPAAPPATPPAAVTPPPGLHVPAQGVSLVGHIERTGDVVALPGQALGAPGSDLRVEGFQVMWPDRPDGVDLAYGIAVEDGGALPTVKTGKFCGTRGQARRITEVTFALIGPRAAAFALDGAAHFTGGFTAPIRAGATLAGPSGLEHLTSLQLRVLPAPVSSAFAPAANPWEDRTRTKLFKQTSET